MARRLTVLAVALVMSAATITACGSDDNSSSDNSGGSSSSASKSSGGTPSPSDPRVKQAVASCKQSVSNAPKLSSSVKSKLDKICEKAGSGDADAVRKASKEVCVQIVKESAPAGSARDQALAACKQTTSGSGGASKGGGSVPSY
jgi:hypothetical protein